MTSTTVDRFNVAPEEGTKAPCRMATTSNVTLTGLQTIDGVVGAENDRVLVKNQTDATENGIWLMESTGWKRAPDWNDSRDASPGVLVPVSEGTAYASTIWAASFTSPLTIDSTSVTFSTNSIGSSQPIVKDNVAQAVADLTLTAGQIVETKGYYTAGDGGAGRYLVKTAAQAVTDGDTIDEIGMGFTLDNGGVLVAQNQTGLRILSQFGAFPSASAATNTTAIQAAYDSLVDKNDVGYVFAGSVGIYEHNGINIGAGVTLVGRGIWDGNATTFKLAAGANTDSFITQQTTFTQYTGFKNLRINGNKTNQVGNYNGINAYWWDIANAIENVAISDCGNAGLFFNNVGTQTGNVLVERCIFNRNDAGAVKVDGPVDNLTLIQCAVEGNGGASGSNIVLKDLNDTSVVNLFQCRGELRATASGGGARHVDMQNCNGALLNIYGGNWQNANNFLEMVRIITSTARVRAFGLSFPSSGWPANPDDVVIRDNVASKTLTYTDLTSKGKDWNWNCEYLHSTSVTGSNPIFGRYFDGSGNTWTLTGSNASPEGVVSANVGSLHVRTSGGTAGCVYQKISGTSTTGWIPLGRDGSLQSFSDGDATPSVAGGSQFRTANTSPTTITFLDGGIQGQEVTVLFNDANTTVDFSASNMKGNAGVDFVANQYASMRCTFDGVRWMCVVSQS